MRHSKIPSFAVNATIFAASSLAALVAAELLLKYRVVDMPPLTDSGYVDSYELAKRTAMAKGSDYDARSTYLVVAERRRAGVKAFPAVSPAYFLSEEKGSRVAVNGQAVLALGIAASSENYYCNESGAYIKFVTDKFGFRNNDAVWAAPAIDIVSVGDSFTMGSCLGDDESIAGNLRGAGKALVNLGMGGNGPLIELASMREYLPHIRPKVVIWNFFPNDFGDLERDNKNLILQKYLEPVFSQKLMGMARELNPEVEKIVEEYYGKLKAVEDAKTPATGKRFYEFPHLLKLYAFVKNRAKERASPPPVNMELFLKIMMLAKAEAQHAGTEMYFVYIPDCINNSYGQDVWKGKLLEGLAALSIPVIDVESNVRAIGAGAYFYCPGSHFTPQGAKATSAAILARLKADAEHESAHGARDKAFGPSAPKNWRRKTACYRQHNGQAKVA